jgi:glycosyltransferase involved in cell wall biosynthesis
MKKNICFLLGSFQTGGAENHVLQILKNLDYSRFNACLAVMKDDGEFKPYFQELGIPIYVVKTYKNKAKRKFLEILKIISFAKFLKKQNIDILHIHLTGCYMFGMYAAYLAGISKKIITWHNIYDNSVRNWSTIDLVFNNLKGFFQVKVASTFANKIIAVSGDVKNKNCRFFKIKSEKVVVVYNGINTDNYKEKVFKNKNVINGKFIIGAVGALQQQKDYITMLKVIRLVSQKYPNVILKIMGEGPERKNIESFIKNNKLKKNIHLEGIVRDIPNVLHQLDLFLMTSLWEGFSIAVLEAMVVGLPIVATKVGGNGEAISHKETGLLVPVKDYTIISGAVEEIICNPKKAEDYGKAAKKRFRDNFTIDAMMQNLDKIFLN